MERNFDDRGASEIGELSERRTERRLLGRNEAQYERLADGYRAQTVRYVDVAAAHEALLADALDVVADLDALHLRQLAALADRTDERVACAVIRYGQTCEKQFAIIEKQHSLAIHLEKSCSQQVNGHYQQVNTYQETAPLSPTQSPCAVPSRVRR